MGHYIRKVMETGSMKMKKNNIKDSVNIDPVLKSETKYLIKRKEEITPLNIPVAP